MPILGYSRVSVCNFFSNDVPCTRRVYSTINQDSSAHLRSPEALPLALQQACPSSADGNGTDKIGPQQRATLKVGGELRSRVTALRREYPRPEPCAHRSCPPRSMEEKARSAALGTDGRATGVERGVKVHGTVNQSYSLQHVLSRHHETAMRAWAACAFSAPHVTPWVSSRLGAV